MHFNYYYTIITKAFELNNKLISAIKEFVQYLNLTFKIQLNCSMNNN